MKKKLKLKTYEIHLSFRGKEEVDLVKRIKKKCDEEGIPFKAIVIGALYEIDGLKKSYIDYIIEAGCRNDKREKARS